VARRDEWFNSIEPRRYSLARNAAFSSCNFGYNRADVVSAIIGVSFEYANLAPPPKTNPFAPLLKNGPPHAAARTTDQPGEKSLS
jgi:hypothetical protein